MLKTGTGIQTQYDANLPFTMIGVPNRPWQPTAIQSRFIDPNSAGEDFIPGITFVSRTTKGTIIRGIAPNSNLHGVVMRGASKETANLTNAQQIFNYEAKGPVPVGTAVTTWIRVITAPTAVESFGIAINDTTGQATTYAVEATAGFYTCGETGADLAAWIAVTDGSFGININGAGITAITGVDFSTATDLTDVAALIEAELTGAFCTYNQGENLFVFTSATESAASAIDLSANATGTSLFLAAFLNADGPPTSGFFTCGTNGATIGEWQAATDASFGINIDGAGVTAITALNLSGAADFAGVATLIEATLTGATCEYDADDDLFIFTSDTTGPLSSIALSADATGTSIFVAAFLNAAAGAATVGTSPKATAGTAAGSAPSGFTAATGISIERWSASDPTKVEVTLSVVSLE